MNCSCRVFLILKSTAWALQNKQLIQLSLIAYILGELQWWIKNWVFQFWARKVAIYRVVFLVRELGHFLLFETSPLYFQIIHFYFSQEYCFRPSTNVIPHLLTLDSFELYPMILDANWVTPMIMVKLIFKIECIFWRVSESGCREHNALYCAIHLHVTYISEVPGQDFASRSWQWPMGLLRTSLLSWSTNHRRNDL